MILQQPFMLWFLLSLIPLAAIYLLKVRPTRKKTTVWFLWDTVLNEKKASALFQRLRDIFSLLLMLLIFLACVFAMTHPVSSSPERMYDLVIIVDNSISMQSADGPGTRLDSAKKLARSIVRAMNLERRAVLATVSGDVKYMVNLTSNQRELSDGIKEIEGTQLPLRYEALKSFCDNSKFLKQVRTILITDGCFEGMDKISGVEVMKVGKHSENIGITGFDLAQMPGRFDQLGLFFRLTSSYKNEREVDVLLAHETRSNLIRVFPVKIKPGESRVETFTVDGAYPGKWFLRIDQKDALSDDNEAYAVVPKKNPINVNLNASEGGQFFKKCIKAFEEEAVGLRLVKKGQDVTLSCGNPGAPEEPLQILFKPDGKSGFWTSTGEKLKDVMARVRLADHEVLKYCELDGVAFKGARQITAPPDALVLLETVDGVPLVYRTASDSGMAYVVNMDPVDSEFFLSAYFPILVYSMARDLTGRTMDFKASYPPGSEVNGVFLDKLGFSEDGKGGIYACSIPGVHESSLDNSAVEDTHRPIDRGWPVSHLLIVFGLIAVVAESMLYHRRKVG